MPVFRVRLVFEAFTDGWQEILFREGDAFTISNTYAFVKDELCRVREGLCGDETQLRYFSVSNEAAKRDIYLSERRNTTRPSVGGSAPPDLALLVRCTEGETGKFRNFYLRGFPQAIVVDDRYTPSAAFTRSLTRYKEVLLQGGLGWKAGGNTASTVKPVANVVQADSGEITLTTTGDLFPVGYEDSIRKIYISGVTGADVINGVQNVVVVNRTTMKLIKHIPMFPYTGGGRVTYNTYSVKKADFMDVTRVTERKAGSPLYHSRGRSRVT